MDAGTIPEALSARLGLEATLELAHLLEQTERNVTDTVLMRSIDRFECRLIEETSKLRVDMLRGEAALRTEIQGVRADLRDQKSEWLRWSFLFWAGQLAAMAALFRLTGR